MPTIGFNPNRYSVLRCGMSGVCDAPLIYPKIKRSVVPASDIEFLSIEDDYGTMQDITKWLVNMDVPFDPNYGFSDTDIRHYQLEGYDAEWKRIMGKSWDDWRVRNIVAFSFVVETARLVSSWHIIEDECDIDKRIASMMDWIRTKGRTLKMRNLFDDGTFELDGAFLNNVLKSGKQCYSRCEEGHIIIAVDGEFVPLLSDHFR